MSHDGLGFGDHTSSTRLIAADQLDKACGLFKALADPTRLNLVYIIAEHGDEPICGQDLADALGVTCPTITHHMKKLVDADLVRRSSHGRWAHYRINPVQFYRFHSLITSL